MSSPSLPIGFPDFKVGDETSKKILVAYASSTGSAGGTAEIIGGLLAEKGAAVEVRPVQAVEKLDGFDAAVIGSAIHGGKWLPEAVTFLQTNQEQLGKIPTAFFLVCLTLVNDTEETKKAAAQFLLAERALVNPVAEGRFAGAVLLNRLPFFMRLPFRIGLVSMGKGWNGGDYRNDDAIRAWAESLLPLLTRKDSD